MKKLIALSLICSFSIVAFAQNEDVAGDMGSQIMRTVIMRALVAKTDSTCTQADYADMIVGTTKDHEGYDAQMKIYGAYLMGTKSSKTKAEILLQGATMTLDPQIETAIMQNAVALKDQGAIAACINGFKAYVSANVK